MKIKDDKEHAIALARVRELWDCDVDGPDGPEFEALISAVSEYEDKRWPIRAPTREELEEFLVDQGVDPKEIPARVAHLFSKKDLN